MIAEQPDLVLWQVGTNSVLRDSALPPHVAELHDGIAPLKATGADVVLMIRNMRRGSSPNPTARAWSTLISATAKAEHIGVFHRFELMRRWYRGEHLPFETFVSADGLHMNDWSYACLAKALGMAIAEAATRPTATAVGRRICALTRDRQQTARSEPLCGRPSSDRSHRFSAVNTSSTRSSGCSSPHESRTRPSLIPSAARAAGVSR